MSAPIILSAAVEGSTDEAVVKRLCTEFEITLDVVYGKQGKSQLLARLSGYNNAARFSPWLVLLDLDNDAACAPEYLGNLPIPSAKMTLRVAVREVEAWLLGDQDNLARFLSVSRARVPNQPESLDDPKRTLISIARHSRRRSIKEDIVPQEGAGQLEGPAYASRIIEFVTFHWRPRVAAGRCPSLNGCLAALERFK